MSRARQAAAALATLRIAYGLALIAAPGRLSQTWLGDGGGSAAAGVGLRGLGARDALLHVGALAGALRDEPVRPWLAAAVLGDCADIAATFAAREGLPAKSPAATAAVAGASALLAGAVIVALEQ